MAKTKRKARDAAESRPEGSSKAAVAEAFALWSRGDVLAARRRAQALLASPGSPEAPPLSEPDRARLQQLLADSAPDPRALQVGVFAAAVVVLVVLLTKFFS